MDDHRQQQEEHTPRTADRHWANEIIVAFIVLLQTRYWSDSNTGFAGPQIRYQNDPSIRSLDWFSPAYQWKGWIRAAMWCDFRNSGM